MRKGLLTLFAFLLCSCGEVYLVKPTKLYLDEQLYRQIKKQEKQVKKLKPKGLIRKQLNDLTTFATKHHRIIQANNRLAAKNK